MVLLHKSRVLQTFGEGAASRGVFCFASGSRDAVQRSSQPAAPAKTPCQQQGRAEMEKYETIIHTARKKRGHRFRNVMRCCENNQRVLCFVIKEGLSTCFACGEMPLEAGGGFEKDGFRHV